MSRLVGPHIFLQLHSGAREGRERTRLWDRRVSCPGPANVRGRPGMR